MRKAKFAALVIGGVSTCIFGGIFGVYATSPVVSSVAPTASVKNICDVKTEELANIAALTSIRTTAATTSRKQSTTTTTTTTAVTTTAETTAVYEAVTETIAVQEVYTAQPVTEAYDVYSDYSEPTEPATEPSEEVYIEPETEAPTEQIAEDTTNEDITEEIPTDASETEIIDEPAEDSGLPISDEDYIILCNAVAHEAGCYWIDEYEKAKVVEVIMNRVYSPYYPNTITGVLTQPYQFSGAQNYVYLGKFSGYVTESVKNAVNLYFSDPDSFAHGYFSFYGDGINNHFS